MITKKLSAYFKEYSEFHQSSANQMTHYFGIPFIMIGLLGLLSQWVIGNMIFPSVSLLRLDGGVFLLFFGLLWYLILDWKITIPFAFFLSGIYFLGRTFSFSINLTLFVLGWALQGIGHALYEKKSPAFLKNATHLLIGPLWIFARMIHYQ